VFSNETEPDFITEPSSEERLTPSTNKGPLHPNRNTSFSHRFQAHQAGLKFSAPTTTQSRHSPSSPPKKSAIIFHDEHFFFVLFERLRRNGPGVLQRADEILTESFFHRKTQIVQQVSLSQNGPKF
jgi:hypothetical protein